MERILGCLSLAFFLLFLSVPHAARAQPLAPASTDAPAALPSDDQIARILQQRVERDQRGVGIVVGVLDAKGPRFVAHGEMRRGGGEVPDSKTLFEIGSISKAFTGTLLASLVATGEVRFAEPVAALLPESVQVPEHGGTITLEALATHASGLPRLPDNMTPANVLNPYADYSVEQLYAFLSGHQLRRDVGVEVEYSNLGFGLLGHALARRAGGSWEELVRARITGPLGMTDTIITLAPAQRQRFATPHRGDLEPTPAWDIPTLAGAGALRSTAADMLLLAAAHLGLGEAGETQEAVRAALQEARRPRRSMGVPGMEIGLGWVTRTGGSSTIVWHNGGTGGSRSFFGVDVEAGRAVVVLTNSEHSADDIGFHLLDPSYELATFGPPPKEIDVAVQDLERYVGRYQLAPGFFVEITREGAQLFAQATGQPRFPVFASAPKEFFFKVVEARLVFEVEGGDSASNLTLYQGGQVIPGPRVTDSSMP